MVSKDIVGRIYVLVDPRTNKIKYVGKTCNSAKERLQQHIDSARAARKTQNPRLLWLCELLSLGLRPIVVEVVEANERELSDLERFWIAALRKRGDVLANVTPGGDGCDSETMSKIDVERWKRASWRWKFRLGMKRAWRRSREKWSNAIRESHNTEEHKRKISEINKKRWEDPVYREKVLRGAKKALERPEVHQRKREAALKRWSDPEQRRKRSELMKHIWAGRKAS